MWVCVCECVCVCVCVCMYVCVCDLALLQLICVMSELAKIRHVLREKMFQFYIFIIAGYHQLCKCN